MSAVTITLPDSATMLGRLLRVMDFPLVNRTFYQPLLEQARQEIGAAALVLLLDQTLVGAPYTETWSRSARVLVREHFPEYIKALTDGDPNGDQVRGEAEEFLALVYPGDR